MNTLSALVLLWSGWSIASPESLSLCVVVVALLTFGSLWFPEIFDLSAATLRVIKQNLFWAFFYKTVGISLAIVGVLNPILAAAMLLSSVSVIVNSLRLANR